MRVELLWWEGCPSHPQALADLRDALREEGIGEEVLEVRHIASDEEAERDGLPRVAHDQDRRARTCSRPRPGDPLRPHLPRLPAARRPRLAGARTPRTCARAETSEGEPMSLAIGDQAPGLSLPDTDGEEHALHGDGSRAWWCSPATTARTRSRGTTGSSTPRATTPGRVRFLAGEPQRRRALSGGLARGDARARGGDGGWPLPYLRDESQEAAREYGAKTTPDVFVLDAGGRLRYRGAPDADHMDPSLNAAWLREALDALLAGQEPARPETDPVGCSVKWRSDRRHHALGVARGPSSTASAPACAQLGHAVGAARHATARAPAVVRRLTSSGVSPISTVSTARRVLGGRAVAGHGHEVGARARAGPSRSRPPPGRASARGRRRPASARRWRRGCP